MATRTRKQQLKVVFDTNVLFTQVASDLLRAEIAQFISQNTEYADLIVTWYLPEIVRDEREYQMLQRATDLLPSVEKLERVLGHQLNISAEILHQRVTAIIAKQVDSFKLQLLPLDTNKVDWSRLSKDAVFRRPPFDPGPKEKGFRDAVIVESFLQLVDASPTTPKVCRLVLLTEDQLLGDAVKARLSGRSNVTVYPSIDELKGFINTIVSNASEEFVAAIQKEAKKLFYDFEKKDGLYAKWEIGTKISADFSEKLKELPEGATSRESADIRLGSPRFVKKVGKQMHWISRVIMHAQSYKIEIPKPPPEFSFGDLTRLSAAPATPALTMSSISSGATASSSSAVSEATHYLASLITPTKIPYKKGNSTFEVAWSASVNHHRKLHSPTLEGITFVGTTWE